MTPFESRVDASLAALETHRPALARLRRIPIDTIAAAVDRELAGTAGPWIHRVLAWILGTRARARTNANIQHALLTIAARNGFLRRANPVP